MLAVAMQLERVAVEFAGAWSGAAQGRSNVAVNCVADIQFHPTPSSCKCSKSIATSLKAVAKSGTRLLGR